MKIIDKYFYNIFFIISISIIVRFYFIDAYGDKDITNEWQILFYNLKENNILAYRSFDGKLIPSVYMPPLYVYYIFFVDLLIPKNISLVSAIIFSQILISSLSIYFFYKINLLLFKKKISFFSTIIFSIFPIHIYSCLQISSITIQIFLNILFLFLIFKIIKNTYNHNKIIQLGIIGGLSMLLRGEFILIFFFTIIFLKRFKIINFNQIIMIITILSIIISPYIIRNYLVFGKFTITKSIGYNLWKGNNINSGIEGSESFRAFNYNKINFKIENLAKDKLYDFNYDKIFLNSSIEFIKQDPILFFERFVKKFFSLTFINLKSNYPNYNHILNILPASVISILFIYGLICGYNKNSIIYKYLIFNLFLTVSIFSLFFILPRYKLIILPIQLIFINFIFKKYKNNNKKLSLGV